MKTLLIRLFNAAIASVDPYRAVKEQSQVIESRIASNHSRNIYVIGFGKAAYPMAHAMEDVLGERLTAGVVITKYGHSQQPSNKVLVLEAGHPIPDENGIKGTTAILELLSETSEKDLVFCLISGGGSALFVQPVEGVHLADIQQLTQELLAAGAEISEVNAIRKHFSMVKGGRLAEYIFPSRCDSFIISDVIGDPLDVIASGPIVADPVRFEDVKTIFDKYDLWPRCPVLIRGYLEKGLNGDVPDTPKAGHPVFHGISNMIIANNKKAIQAIEKEAMKIGYMPVVLSESLIGEAREQGIYLAEQAKRHQLKGQKICLISGGETTVTLKGKGKGGRNMELALAFQKTLKDHKGIFLLSAGTDGTDGPTDAAGAFVTESVIQKTKELNLDLDAYLNQNDSYHFYEQTGGLFKPGPTGTNVMDIQIGLVDGKIIVGF